MKEIGLVLLSFTGIQEDFWFMWIN